MKWPMVKFSQIVSDTGIFSDGDWIESKDQNPDGHVRLVQLADIGVGRFIDKSNRFMTEESAEKLKCTYLKEGDILVARMPDPIGRACIFPSGLGKCVTVVDICIIRPNSKDIYDKWLMHLINSNMFNNQINQHVTGTTRQRISRGNLAKLKIPLPPLEEQKRIAVILDKADAIRRKRQQAIQLADDFLRSVFLDMFGDPVTNPKGWEVKPLKQLAKVTTGTTPSRKEAKYYGDHIEWIKSDNINTPSHFLTKSSEHLSEEGMQVARVVGSGSTLVTCIAGSFDCIGNAAYADREVTFNQQINALTPLVGVTSWFLYALVLFSKKHLQSASTNSMKGMLSKGKMEEIPMISPPLSIQENFQTVFLKYLSLNNKLDYFSNSSTDVFLSLGQKAFAGEL